MSGSLGAGILAATYDGEGEDDHGGVFLQAASVSATGVTLDVGPVDDRSVDELATLTLNVPFETSDGSSVTFSLSRTIDDAVIDPSTGEFSWTPTEDQGPGEYAITVVATSFDDPDLLADSTFIVTVAETNIAQCSM